MIVGKLENITNYKNVLPHLEEGLKEIQKYPNEVGEKHTFDGGYYFVQEGDTSPLAQKRYEAHRKYIDVQILLDGCEVMAWKDLKEVEEIEPYDETGDKAFYQSDKEYHFLISKDMFWVAYPEDAHVACAHIEQPNHYKKIVLKLQIEKESD